MFSHILRFMHLTKDDSDAGERRDHLQIIRSIGSSSAVMMDELCLQLLKQTRDNRDSVQEKNAFEIFSILSESMHCSEVCSCVTAH